MRAEVAQSQAARPAMRGTSVLHVVASAGRYGAEAVIAALCCEQHALGMHVHVAIISDNVATTAPYVEELQHGHAEVTVIKGQGLRDLFLAKRIAEIAMKAGASIVHSHGYKSDILCSRLHLPNVRRISTLHGWTSVRPWSRMALYQSMQVRALSQLDAVVAVHESVWRQHPGLRAISKQISIANGIPDLDSIEVPDDQFEWLPASRPPTILVVGRISPEKGQLLAVDAIVELKRRGVDVLLVCAGEGPQLSTLKARVAKQGLGDRVLLPGYVRSIPALMQRATILLIPSSTEGMPMILLEAMRNGLPVVATAVGGMASVLDYGQAGRLVTPGSALQVAEAIEGLLREESQRESVKYAASRRFAEHYSARIMALKYHAEYERMLAYSLAGPATVPVGVG